MRDETNIKDVIDLEIDWLGLIFWQRSPRNVSRKPQIDKHGVKLVGVFVNETVENIVKTKEDYDLDIIQLHGNESPDFIKELTAEFVEREYQSASNNKPYTRPKMMKAISVSSKVDIAKTRDYEKVVDYFLFDTKTPKIGGSGQQFDWSVIDLYKGRKPFILSGGIGPDDAERIAKFHHPQFAGIDLNSRFETEPGLKDVEAIKKFMLELIRLEYE